MENNPIMKGIIWFAEHFIGLFNESAASFTGLVTGILPLLMVMLTAMYAITTWIGEERVTNAVKWAGRFAVTRYTIMPFLAMLLLTNPMAYTFGRFLPERYKPAFYDAAVSFCHPITSLFPHANAGEIFVWGRCLGRRVADRPGEIRHPGDSLLPGWFGGDPDPRHRHPVDDLIPDQARRTRRSIQAL